MDMNPSAVILYDGFSKPTIKKKSWNAQDVENDVQH